ncbi:hypothetical protein [Vibrio parahaemolyticus]|uniref:hypothetical protein n=1 Tax=Vibrio parahaemolyticus TaxID=670 RepID=UPI001F2776DB|nr:hypothetical protein [Vibrio parahaemolyticus]MCG0014578.1 hypothetical protein [Vibrio parahaemolyticus]MDL2000024.1 hypothetical protein [Vibrio parahaemolyticus]
MIIGFNMYKSWLAMSRLDKKYKLTRQLLKLAIEVGGYRNEDIAVKAGLSGKSVAQVSAWRNGRTNVTEWQMAYFIKEYGHLLKRKMEHLYYTVLIKEGEEKLTFVKISGELVFKHQIKIIKGNRCLDNSKDLNVLRVLVLRDGNKFNLLYQYRAGLLNLTEEVVDGQKVCSANRITPEKIVHSDNEDSNWYGYDIKREQGLDELVQLIQKYCRSLIKGKNLIDNANRQSNSYIESSAFFDSRNIYPLELSFYQKMLSLNLHSEHFPF